MTIYFAGSIRGGRGDQALYAQLIAHLQRYGTVLTEHLGSARLSSYGETDLSDDQIFRRDAGWLEQAEVVVAEVTTPSTGVGYELGRAEAHGRRILCLFRPQEGRRLSAMVSGNKALTVVSYGDLEEAKQRIDQYFTRR